MCVFSLRNVLWGQIARTRRGSFAEEQWEQVDRHKGLQNIIIKNASIVTSFLIKLSETWEGWGFRAMLVSSGLLLSTGAVRKNSRFPLCPHFYLWIADKWGKRDYMNIFSYFWLSTHIPKCALLLSVCSASCKTKTMAYRCNVFRPLFLWFLQWY